MMNSNSHLKPKRKFKAVAASFLSIALVTQLTGCGTLFYPERKGLSGGRLDPAIVALDGLGLILFLIPGIVALGVDFYNGTIYLPGTQTSQLTEEELKQITVNGSVDVKMLERVLSSKLKQTIELENTTETVPFSSAADLANAVNLSGAKTQLVLNK